MNLTDEQKTALNVGLATWEGWRKLTGNVWARPGSDPRNYFFGDHVTEISNYLDPLTGLSHIHRMETKVSFRQYMDELARVVNVPGGFKSGHFDYADLTVMVCASAEQRAIALCRALNINIEGVTQ